MFNKKVYDMRATFGCANQLCMRLRKKRKKTSFPYEDLSWYDENHWTFSLHKSCWLFIFFRLQKKIRFRSETDHWMMKKVIIINVWLFKFCHWTMFEHTSDRTCSTFSWNYDDNMEICMRSACLHSENNNNNNNNEKHSIFFFSFGWGKSRRWNKLNKNKFTISMQTGRKYIINDDIFNDDLKTIPMLHCFIIIGEAKTKICEKKTVYNSKQQHI